MLDQNNTSPDVEKHEEEEKESEVQEKQQRKVFLRTCVEFMQVGFKVVELLLCAACMGFVYEPAEQTGLGKLHLHHVGVMYASCAGYILINMVHLASHIVGDRIPFKTYSIFTILGTSMFLVTGILLTVDRYELTRHYIFHPSGYLTTMLTTSIVFAFMNSAVFVIDTIFTLVKQRDF